MVFCKECKQKVEECPHFVDPIRAPRIKVLDEKIDSLAYSEPERILEITYKNGQVWQLFPVPPSMYGEIRHNGDVQLCSDSYGDPDYTIGNLFDSSLPEIWRSERRRAVLARIDERACWKTRCPHNSRGHHHNRVFHQIEQLRRVGRMDLVRSWVEDLRACTLPLRHSFFV